MICLIAVFVSSRSWRKNCAAKIASTARSKQPSIRLAIFSLDFKIMPYSACRPWFRVQFNDCLSRQCLPSRTGLCIIFFVADTAYFETHRDFVNTERPPSCSLTYELNMMLFHDDASINRRCHANPVDIPLPTGHWIYTILEYIQKFIAYNTALGSACECWPKNGNQSPHHHIKWVNPVGWPPQNIAARKYQRTHSTHMLSHSHIEDPTASTSTSCGAPFAHKNWSADDRHSKLKGMMDYDL